MLDIEKLYKKYGPMVMRRCKFMLKNEDEAFDATQEVFLQVLRRQDSLNDKAPSSLLYTIATNTCLNKIRGLKRKPETSSDKLLLEIASSEDFEKRFFATRVLEKIFSKSKEGTKTIAVLHFIDRFTLEETAEMMGMSVSGVRKRLRALREKGLAVREEM